jgi:hypothetical protein
MTAGVRCIECDHLPERNRPCPVTRRPVTNPRHVRTCAAFEPRQNRPAPVRVAAPAPTPIERPPRRPPLEVAPPVLPLAVRAVNALAASRTAGNVALLTGIGRGRVLVRLLPGLTSREAFATMTAIDRAMRC